jgi:hypothetical protein
MLSAHGHDELHLVRRIAGPPGPGQAHQRYSWAGIDVLECVDLEGRAGLAHERTLVAAA